MNLFITHCTNGTLIVNPFTYELLDGLIMPWCNQVSKYLCTSPWSCLGIVQCGKDTGLSSHCWYHMFYEVTIFQVFTLYEDLLVVINQIDKMLCWYHIKLVSFPMFSWKGSQSISFLQLKSVELVSDLGPNLGFSILGLMSWVGPASTWQLLVSISCGGTGWNLIEMLSPSWSIVALYSFSVHSASYNSAANKGCLIHTLYLLVLIIITGIVLAFGIATCQLITMPSGILWCSASSTRHVILGAKLLVHPRIVMVELPGMQIGCCLVPIFTWSISPSFLLKMVGFFLAKWANF